MFKAVRGVKDILPEDVYAWQDIEKLARRIFSLYGYKEIRTPTIEESGLFNRSLGSSSEIIQKQMFEIKRDRETLVLRPEATASVVRAYIENNLDKKQGFSKFYYLGPMFRAERPQKGRLRQFHHIGVEAVGSLNPDLDVEVISLSNRLLNDFNIKGFTIFINSLGCANDKNNFSAILKSKLKNKLKDLCDDCHDRFKRNVFRILDCKNEGCIETVKSLNFGTDYLCKDCHGHFLKVKEGLDILGVAYQASPQLVRGLDYYTRTVFEIKHQGLGSQDALGAGGRYDNLVKELGGPDLGAIGFALGIERILLVLGLKSGVSGENNLVYIITLGESTKEAGLKLLDNLRKNGIQADTDYLGKSLKGAMRNADDLGARFVLIIGEDELKKGAVTLKNMVSGEQKEVITENLITELKAKALGLG
jgi:histidyl-tRNA synthetase